MLLGIGYLTMRLRVSIQYVYSWCVFLCVLHIVGFGSEIIKSNYVSIMRSYYKEPFICAGVASCAHSQSGVINV